MPSRRRMTVIVVPETGKRPVTFRFSLYWLIPFAVLILGLSAALLAEHRQNQTMQAQLAELDSLRRTNRQQTAELEGLQHQANQTGRKLTELQALEEQLREMVGQPLPSRGGGGTPSAVHTGDSGGRSAGDAYLTNIPSLGAMFPPDVRTYVFGKRDTFPMFERVPSADTESAIESEQFAVLGTQLDGQLTAMERLAAALKDGQQDLTEYRHYLAHRPFGVPVADASFTDRYGWRWSPFGWGRQWHDGLDIAQDYGVPIVATADGVVIHSGWKTGGYGYAVMVDHGYGFVTLYAHMSDTNAELWQEVKRGDLIGWVGSTGDSTGPHLHYEVHVNGVPVDPAEYLQ